MNNIIKQPITNQNFTETQNMNIPHTEPDYFDEYVFSGNFMGRCLNDKMVTQLEVECKEASNFEISEDLLPEIKNICDSVDYEFKELIENEANKNFGNFIEGLFEFLLCNMEESIDKEMLAFIDQLKEGKCNPWDYEPTIIAKFLREILIDPNLIIERINSHPISVKNKSSLALSARSSKTMTTKEKAKSLASVSDKLLIAMEEKKRGDYINRLRCLVTDLY